MPKKIIVIEDEKTIRNLYRRILSETDYLVTMVENIVEAEVEIKKNKYDLFITDLLLPDGIGTDLISLIRGKDVGAIILLITGSLTHEERLAHVEKFRLNGCLDKPFNVQEFMTIIERSLGA